MTKGGSAKRLRKMTERGGGVTLPFFWNNFTWTKVVFVRFASILLSGIFTVSNTEQAKEAEQAKKTKQAKKLNRQKNGASKKAEVHSSVSKE